MTFTAFIPGRPVPFARPRFNGGRGYQDPTYAAWKRGAAFILRAAAAGEPVISRQPLALRVEVYHPRPQARPSHVPHDAWKAGTATWAICRSDTDNIGKAVMDALQDSRAIEDDRWVARIEVVSMYAAEGGQVGVGCVLTSLVHTATM